MLPRLTTFILKDILLNMMLHEKGIPFFKKLDVILAVWILTRREQLFVLYVMCLLPLATFKICLFFTILMMISSGLVLFMYILFYSLLSFLDL